MSILSRPQRFFWVLGILLLVGTGAGAGWFFSHGDGKDARDDKLPADFIYALGYVDVLDGIAALHPLQAGRVEALYVRDNDAVNEGDLLLSTDNRLSLEKLKGARADLEDARELVSKAE